MLVSYGCCEYAAALYDLRYDTGKFYNSWPALTLSVPKHSSLR